MAKNQIEKTSADKTAVGFDYQYYFFLWKILSLRTGQSIGWEIKDDIHIDIGEEQILYQIKHTVQNKSDNAPINLTTFDRDLWKTIANWVKVITDKNDDRKAEKKQIQFLEKTTFILATNKSATENNHFLNYLKSFQENNENISATKEQVSALLNKTKDNTIKKYIELLLELNDEVFTLFLKKIRFELDGDDILAKCKDAIKADKVSEYKIDDTFKKIDSALREDNFITIKSGEKVLISFDDFYKKYRKYYDVARGISLTIKPFDGILPDKLEEQTFIKQLVDIGDIQSDNFEEMAIFTKFKLQIHNNLEEWYQNGEIILDELERFKNEAVAQWTSEFRPKYREDIADEDINQLALKILDEIRRKSLSLSYQSLGLEVSNGYYYKLADEPVIGWRNDWKKRYKYEN